MKELEREVFLSLSQRQEGLSPPELSEKRALFPTATKLTSPAWTHLTSTHLRRGGETKGLTGLFFFLVLPPPYPPPPPLSSPSALLLASPPDGFESDYYESRAAAITTEDALAKLRMLFLLSQTEWKR